MQSTKLVLGISNWHFNRDTQHLVEAPRCKIDDINITFKLASSAFSAEDTGSASTTSKTSTSNALNDDSQLKYDRNGATVPYAAFVSLMETKTFHDYMKKIQTVYEQKEGVIPVTDLDTETNDDNDNDAAAEENNEGEEEEEEVSKKGKKRTKVLSETEEEPEIEQPAEIPSENDQQQQQQQQPSMVTAKTTTRRGTKKTLLQNVDAQ